jgi:hypothetical protein
MNPYGAILVFISLVVFDVLLREELIFILTKKYSFMRKRPCELAGFKIFTTLKF